MIITIKTPQIRKVMADTAFKVLNIDSLSDISGKKIKSMTPRLFVLKFEDSEYASKSKIVTKIKKTFPVVDIIAWVENAKAKTVLKLLDQGVANCYLETDESGLKQMIVSTMDQQNFVTALASEDTEKRTDHRFDDLISRSTKMWDIFEQVQQIATTDASVLILGETGTGKELLARAIHKRSNRTGKFVAINCAAIPEQLINSELFGHVKGAFTGADTNKTGLFMYADQGTILLDEIGNMPESSQNHLLRVLQERKIRPVGSHSEQEVNVRIIAATSQPLETFIQKGKFREDLFYRLDVLRFMVPPVRERPEDIIFLMHHFLKEFSKQYQISFPKIGEDFIDSLTDFNWPGNVRQLSNIAERLILTYPEQKLTAAKFRALTRPYKGKQGKNLVPKIGSEKKEDVPEGQNAQDHSALKKIESTFTSNQHKNVEMRLSFNPEETYENAIGTNLEKMEKIYFEKLLESNKFKMQVSAEKAGISRRTLLRKLKQLGLK